MKRSLWPTRDSVKDYFPLPKEIFSLSLSAAEIAIYAYLLFCEDRQTFQCWPSYRKIGEAVGLSPNTIRKHIRSLEERGLLITEPTTVTTNEGCKRNGNLLFTIQPIQAALQQDYDRQMQKLDEDMAKRKYADFIENMGWMHSKNTTPTPSRPWRRFVWLSLRSRACTSRKPEGRTLHRRAGALRTRQTQKKNSCRRISAEGEAASGEAGQSRGVVRAPRRSQLPAVRAVSGIYEGVVERAKIAPVGSQFEKSQTFQGKQRGCTKKVCRNRTNSGSYSGG